MEVDKKKYEEYVKEITPVHSLPKSMACAFLVGGIICLIGQEPSGPDPSQHSPDRP